MTSSRKLALGTLTILLLASLPYLPALYGEFVFDDQGLLIQNPIIHASDGLLRFWFSTECVDYWPVTYTTYWFEWRLWGTNPTGYHVLNVLLHGVCSLLLWRVLVALSVPGAWMAGAVFAIHPVNVEAVAWIFQRKTLLAAVFLFASLLALLRQEREGGRKWYVLGLLAFLLGILSKTSVVTFPVLLLGLAWWKRGRISRRDVAASLPFFLVAFLGGITAIWFQYNQSIAGTAIRSEGFLSRLAGAGSAVWFYAWKAVWPVDLCFVYPRWEIDGGSFVAYIPLLLLMVLAAVVWKQRVSWGRPILAGLGFFVVLLFPVLGFIDVFYMRYSLVADHWQYPAMAGVTSLLIGSTVHWTRRWGARPPSLLAAGIIVVAVLLALTWTRAGVYRTAEALWADTLDRNPKAWVAHLNIGRALFKEGKINEAADHFASVIELKPDHVKAHSNLATVHDRRGELKEAIQMFKEALRLDPDFATAHSNLSSVYAKAGRNEEALHHAERAAQLEPGRAEIRSNFGNMLRSAKRYADAETELREAIRIEPGFLVPKVSLGILHSEVGRLPQAEAVLREVLDQDPNLTAVRKILGDVCWKQQKISESAAQYRKVLRDTPDDFSVVGRLAWILATTDDPSLRDEREAIALAEGACRRTQNREPFLLEVLATAYAEAGRFDEAATTAQAALSIILESGDEARAESIAARIAAYQHGTPYRSGSPTSSEKDGDPSGSP